VVELAACETRGGGAWDVRRSSEIRARMTLHTVRAIAFRGRILPVGSAIPVARWTPRSRSFKSRYSSPFARCVLVLEAANLARALSERTLRIRSLGWESYVASGFMESLSALRSGRGNLSVCMRNAFRRSN
jgi:hypothetical protein